MSGRFARRNSVAIKKLNKTGLFEFENHSWSHKQHLPRLSDEKFNEEIKRSQYIIQKICGRRPLYFRFPAGIYDARTLYLVEEAGLKVVHWTYPSGDADSTICAEALTNDAMQLSKAGDILIFHINRRGYSTANALPDIVNSLKAQGFTLVKLDELLAHLPAIQYRYIPVQAVKENSKHH